MYQLLKTFNTLRQRQNGHYFDRDTFKCIFLNDFFIIIIQISLRSLFLRVQLREPCMLCCHQVRCMYWEHLGHFHRAVSHSKWYKVVCKRYLACTFSQMKSINMFSMFLQNGVPRHFLWKFIAVWIFNLFSCLCMSMLTSNSSSNMQKHGYLGMFSCCIRQGKYILGLGN